MITDRCQYCGGLTTSGGHALNCPLYPKQTMTFPAPAETHYITIDTAKTIDVLRNRVVDLEAENNRLRAVIQSAYHAKKKDRKVILFSEIVRATAGIDSEEAEND